MAKPGTPLPAAGLSEWLPLLGSICQVLAAMGEDKEPEAEQPQAATGQTLPAGRASD